MKLVNIHNNPNNTNHDIDEIAFPWKLCWNVKSLVGSYTNNIDEIIFPWRTCLNVKSLMASYTNKNWPQ